MDRRRFIKILHWVSVALLLYFFFVEPEDVRQLQAAALATHAGMGVILGLVALIWCLSALRSGLLGRPGPKLKGIVRTAHPWGHRVLYILLPGVVLSGALAGVAAPYVIYAFDLMPISFGTGTRQLHGIFKEIHEIAFNVIMIAGIIHALFHIWRHVWLKDNALKLMFPRVLHRFL